MSKCTHSIINLAISLKIPFAFSKRISLPLGIRNKYTSLIYLKYSILCVLHFSDEGISVFMKISHIMYSLIIVNRIALCDNKIRIAIM